MFTRHYLPGILSLCLLILSGSFVVSAQSSSAERADAGQKASEHAEKEKTDAHQSEQGEPHEAAEARTRRWLQSNELLVETPYLQERGEVEHSFSMRRTRNENWVSTFRQEWPLFSNKHQLSFSIPAQTGRNEAAQRGFGDVEVEYQYQLIGSNESRLTIAPGVGVSFPTGSLAKELGAGAPGFALSLPVGFMLTPALGLNTHLETGIFRHTRNSAQEPLHQYEFAAGQSLVWYVRPKLNALLEAKWERSVIREGENPRQHEDELFVAPGIRWAHILNNRFVIIPGISVPLGVGPSRGDRGIMFSFAVEHPFGRRRG